ncbi:MAG: T9SS type A sorting domain-containing protein [Flavobacteriales bacterium]|nr:T9SS type A sorting domain-containing protein [Flavobacteriales bacterium]
MSFLQRPRALIIAVLSGAILLLAAWADGRLPKASAYHSDREMAIFKGGGGLASGSNNFFMASGECYGCHGPDIMNNYASVDADGNDVNVMDDWRSTMMANSARDPFWRAKVSHEVAVNPAHQTALEDKCTSCHAPMGRYDHFYSGTGPYGISQLIWDPVAQDGVSCLACHMQGPDSLGLLFSGELRFDTNRVVYGPYDNVFGSPMTSFVGYTPLFGAHINDAGLCAGCHTLITETADLQGNPTGDHFVEQATYHEWINSVFDTNSDPEGGVSCQGCHVPRIDDAVVISANYLFLQGHSPFGLHHFAGANTFMLELLKNNITALGLTATPEQFDSTIARTDRLLKQNTLLMDVSVTERDLDTAFIAVKLTNLAGHKFPSGYPARRAFIELTVRDAGGNVMFQSGGWDPQYEVIGHDDDWEPHHDVIRAPQQAQIYEMVMGDVNGDKTTVLERAKFPLKDNRLPPLGFTTTHPSYDTTLIAGVPAGDVDFNRFENGVEGSGTDITHYHVPMNGHSGLIEIEARVWYQAAPPRWMEEMFAYSTPEIDTFRAMYEAADGTPVLIKETAITDLSVGIDDLRELGVRIFPNPVRDGLLRIEGIGARVQAIEVYDLRGASVAKLVPAGEKSWTVRLPRVAATYVVVVRTAGRDFVERVVAF